MLLATAYRLVPLSVVYPIARGGAPVLVLLFGAVALGRTTSWTQVAAVVLVVAGILLVRGFRGADPRGVAFGLAIASCIAVYTLVDKEGVRHAEPITYLELSMIFPAVAYAGAVIRVKGLAAVRRAIGPASIVAGICTFAAYALVLAALQRASAASVAAVRETSVVIAALLAGLVLKEKVTAQRLAGAVLVAQRRGAARALTRTRFGVSRTRFERFSAATGSSGRAFCAPPYGRPRRRRRH